jgi:hypothetical protein
MLLEAQMWAMQMAVVWLDGMLASECPPFSLLKQKAAPEDQLKEPLPARRKN